MSLTLYVLHMLFCQSNVHGDKLLLLESKHQGKVTSSCFNSQQSKHSCRCLNPINNAYVCRHQRKLSSLSRKPMSLHLSHTSFGGCGVSFKHDILRLISTTCSTAPPDGTNTTSGKHQFSMQFDLELMDVLLCGNASPS